MYDSRKGRIIAASKSLYHGGVFRVVTSCVTFSF